MALIRHKQELRVVEVPSNHPYLNHPDWETLSLEDPAPEEPPKPEGKSKKSSKEE